MAKRWGWLWMFGLAVSVASMAASQDVTGKLRRPKNDDEKRDQWLIRLSRTVGRNLTRFFEAWGIPVSESAKQAVADLPEWMPENFPPK